MKNPINNSMKRNFKMWPDAEIFATLSKDVYVDINCRTCVSVWDLSHPSFLSAGNSKHHRGQSNLIIMVTPFN